jgi:hypothetical protein
LCALCEVFFLCQEWEGYGGFTRPQRSVLLDVILNLWVKYRISWLNSFLNLFFLIPYQAVH